VIAAITAAEHGPLEPGEIAAAFRAWETMARQGGVYRPASNPCGYPRCCGPDPRADPDAPWWERRRPIGWQPPR
jgi:hypothetical protein